MIVGEETGALFITVSRYSCGCKEIRLDTSILCNTLKTTALCYSNLYLAIETNSVCCISENHISFHQMFISVT